jgi:hypothetical protein
MLKVQHLTKGVPCSLVVRINSHGWSHFLQEQPNDFEAHILIINTILHWTKSSKFHDNRHLTSKVQLQFVNSFYSLFLWHNQKGSMGSRPFACSSHRVLYQPPSRRFAGLPHSSQIVKLFFSTSRSIFSKSSTYGSQ